jgi:hypothetical protein
MLSGPGPAVRPDPACADLTLTAAIGFYSFGHRVQINSHYYYYYYYYYLFVYFYNRRYSELPIKSLNKPYKIILV